MVPLNSASSKAWELMRKLINFDKSLSLTPLMSRCTTPKASPAAPVYPASSLTTLRCVAVTCVLFDDVMGDPVAPLTLSSPVPTPTGRLLPLPPQPPQKIQPRPSGSASNMFSNSNVYFA